MVSECNCSADWRGGDHVIGCPKKITKFCIKRLHDSQYLTQRASWTHDIVQAAIFDTSEEATDVAGDHPRAFVQRIA